MLCPKEWIISKIKLDKINKNYSITRVILLCGSNNRYYDFNYSVIPIQKMIFLQYAKLKIL